MPYTDSEPELFRINRPGSTPLVFDGWLLANIDSRELWNDHQRKYRDRWSDVSIYRTMSGKWVYAQVGKTREENYRERAVVRVCDTPAELYDALKAREKYITKLATTVLMRAIDSDPELAELAEERI